MVMEIRADNSRVFTIHSSSGTTWITEHYRTEQMCADGWSRIKSTIMIPTKVLHELVEKDKPYETT